LCRAVFGVLGSGVDEHRKFLRHHSIAVGAKLPAFREIIWGLSDLEVGDSKLSLQMPVTIHQYTLCHIPEDLYSHVLFIQTFK
jgi:hypothetical protein